MIDFEIPLRLVAAGNAREHWRMVAKRKKTQRGLAHLYAAGFAIALSKLKRPVMVTLTRIGKRKMDGDNLQGSAKYVRDGIADALGVDDGDESKVTWAYKQKIGKDYACRVRIEGA